MRIQKLKIFYYLVFVIYLTSINVHPFFHHHEEGHNYDESGNRLHSHSFDNLKTDDLSIQSGFHSADNKYFDDNHRLNSFSLLIINSAILFTPENIEVDNKETSTFTIHQFRTDTKFLRDKYVLSEANLPPPLS